MGKLFREDVAKRIRIIILTIAALGVFSSTALPAQAAPAPPCNYPVQCSPDGKVRLGFSEVTPARVVDWWVPANSAGSGARYIQKGGTQLFENIRLLETGSDGYAHYQGVFPSSEVVGQDPFAFPVADDPTTQVKINYHDGNYGEAFFSVSVVAPATGFECTTSGKRKITAQCTFDARRSGLQADVTLALYSQKRGSGWKAKKTVQASQAFSSAGSQTSQTAPLKVKCKPGKKYRVSASGELSTEADGQLWPFDQDESSKKKVKCKK